MALFFGAEFPIGLSDRTSFDNMLPIHIIQANHNEVNIFFTKLDMNFDYLFRSSYMPV